MTAAQQQPRTSEPAMMKLLSSPTSKCPSLFRADKAKQLCFNNYLVIHILFCMFSLPVLQQLRTKQQSTTLVNGCGRTNGYAATTTRYYTAAYSATRKASWRTVRLYNIDADSEPYLEAEDHGIFFSYTGSMKAAQIQFIEHRSCTA